MSDHVAAIIEAWRREQPHLDVSPVGVFGRISRIERFKDRALRAVYRAHRIDGGEYDVLAALRRSGPPHQLTPTKLYQSSLVTSATMTERLDRLERRKLIYRQPARDDRRSVDVKLTAQGLALFDKAHTALLTTDAELLRALTPKEQTALSDLLQRLATSLEASPESA
jgi:DNA-binding MarR family transcriptional regulator